MSVRPTYLVPPSTGQPILSTTVDICHPGYSEETVLLRLETVPTGPNLDGPFALHHQTVLDACRIISNNEDGFLSTSCDRSGRVPVETVLLTGTAYWYFLDESQPELYPIVDNFAAWSFPHAVPSHWAFAHQNEATSYPSSASEMSTVVRTEDKKCIVSQVASEASLQNARLIPREQDAWFHRNRMHRYSRGYNSTEDPANGVTLSSHIHLCLDKTNALVFVPIEGKFVAHFLSYQCERDWVVLYHGALVAMPPRVKVEFLYARFAYNILRLSKKTTSRHRFLVRVPILADPPLCEPSTDSMPADSIGPLAEAALAFDHGLVLKDPVLTLAEAAQAFDRGVIPTDPILTLAQAARAFDNGVFPTDPVPTLAEAAQASDSMEYDEDSLDDEEYTASMDTVVNWLNTHPDI